MKKLIFLILVFIIFSFCGPKKEEIERFLEDGVEVVVNHLEPFEIKGMRTDLTLEEIFRIDTEKDEMAEIGQGPGEVQRPTFITVSSQDEIFVLDKGNTKLIIYGKDGELISETPVDPSLVEATPLNSEKYLIKQRTIPEDEASEFLALDLLIICGQDFEKESELDIEKIPSISRITRFRPMFSVFYSLSDSQIFVGNSDKGYEIKTYDFHGNGLRKLRKQYQPVKVPEGSKEKLEKLLAQMGRTISFPEFMPPFQYLFADDVGRLFIMTYEKGEKALLMSGQKPTAFTASERKKAVIKNSWFIE